MENYLCLLLPYYKRFLAYPQPKIDAFYFVDIPGALMGHTLYFTKKRLEKMPFL